MLCLAVLYAGGRCGGESTAACMSELMQHVCKCHGHNSGCRHMASEAAQGLHLCIHAVLWRHPCIRPQWQILVAFRCMATSNLVPCLQLPPLLVLASALLVACTT